MLLYVLFSVCALSYSFKCPALRNHNDYNDDNNNNNMYEYNEDRMLDQWQIKPQAQTMLKRARAILYNTAFQYEQMLKYFQNSTCQSYVREWIQQGVSYKQWSGGGLGGFWGSAFKLPAGTKYTLLPSLTQVHHCEKKNMVISMFQVAKGKKRLSIFDGNSLFCSAMYDNNQHYVQLKYGQHMKITIRKNYTRIQYGTNPQELFIKQAAIMKQSFARDNKFQAKNFKLMTNVTKIFQHHMKSFQRVSGVNVFQIITGFQKIIFPLEKQVLKHMFKSYTIQAINQIHYRQNPIIDDILANITNTPRFYTKFTRNHPNAIYQFEKNRKYDKNIQHRQNEMVDETKPREIIEQQKKMFDARRQARNLQFLQEIKKVQGQLLMQQNTQLAFKIQERKRSMYNHHNVRIQANDEIEQEEYQPPNISQMLQQQKLEPYINLSGSVLKYITNTNFGRKKVNKLTLFYVLISQQINTLVIYTFQRSQYYQQQLKVYLDFKQRFQFLQVYCDVCINFTKNPTKKLYNRIMQLNDYRTDYIESPQGQQKNSLIYQDLFWRQEKQIQDLNEIPSQQQEIKQKSPIQKCISPLYDKFIEQFANLSNLSQQLYFLAIIRTQNGALNIKMIVNNILMIFQRYSELFGLIDQLHLRAKLDQQFYFKQRLISKIMLLKSRIAIGVMSNTLVCKVLDFWYGLNYQYKNLIFLFEEKFSKLFCQIINYEIMASNTPGYIHKIVKLDEKNRYINKSTLQFYKKQREQLHQVLFENMSQKHEAMRIYRTSQQPYLAALKHYSSNSNNHVKMLRKLKQNLGQIAQKSILKKDPNYQMVKRPQQNKIASVLTDMQSKVNLQQLAKILQKLHPQLYIYSPRQQLWKSSNYLYFKLDTTIYMDGNNQPFNDFMEVCQKQFEISGYVSAQALQFKQSPRSLISQQTQKDKEIKQKLLNQFIIKKKREVTNKRNVLVTVTPIGNVHRVSSQKVQQTQTIIQNYIAQKKKQKQSAVIGKQIEASIDYQHLISIFEAQKQQILDQVVNKKQVVTQIKNIEKNIIQYAKKQTNQMQTNKGLLQYMQRLFPQDGYLFSARKQIFQTLGLDWRNKSEIILISDLTGFGVLKNRFKQLIQSINFHQLTSYDSPLHEKTEKRFFQGFVSVVFSLARFVQVDKQEFLTQFFQNSFMQALAGQKVSKWIGQMNTAIKNKFNTQFMSQQIQLKQIQNTINQALISHQNSFKVHLKQATSQIIQSNQQMIATIQNQIQLLRSERDPNTVGLNVYMNLHGQQQYLIGMLQQLGHMFGIYAHPGTEGYLNELIFRIQQSKFPAQYKESLSKILSVITQTSMVTNFQGWDLKVLNYISVTAQNIQNLKQQITNLKKQLFDTNSLKNEITRLIKGMKQNSSDFTQNTYRMNMLPHSQILDELKQSIRVQEQLRQQVIKKNQQIQMILNRETNQKENRQIIEKTLLQLISQIQNYKNIAMKNKRTINNLIKFDQQQFQDAKSVSSLQSIPRQIHFDPSKNINIQPIPPEFNNYANAFKKISFLDRFRQGVGDFSRKIGLGAVQELSEPPQTQFHSIVQFDEAMSMVSAQQKFQSQPSMVSAQSKFKSQASSQFNVAYKKVSKGQGFTKKIQNFYKTNQALMKHLIQTFDSVRTLNNQENAILKQIQQYADRHQHYKAGQKQAVEIKRKFDIQSQKMSQVQQKFDQLNNKQNQIQQNFAKTKQQLRKMQNARQQIIKKHADQEKENQQKNQEKIKKMQNTVNQIKKQNQRAKQQMLRLKQQNDGFQQLKVKVHERNQQLKKKINELLSKSKMSIQQKSNLRRQMQKQDADFDVIMWSCLQQDLNLYKNQLNSKSEQIKKRDIIVERFQMMTVQNLQKLSIQIKSYKSSLENDYYKSLSFLATLEIDQVKKQKMQEYMEGQYNSITQSLQSLQNLVNQAYIMGKQTKKWEQTIAQSYKARNTQILVQMQGQIQKTMKYFIEKNDQFVRKTKTILVQEMANRQKIKNIDEKKSELSKKEAILQKDSSQFAKQLQNPQFYKRFTNLKLDIQDKLQGSLKQAVLNYYQILSDQLMKGQGFQKSLKYLKTIINVPGHQSIKPQLKKTTISPTHIKQTTNDKNQERIQSQDYHQIRNSRNNEKDLQKELQLEKQFVIFLIQLLTSMFQIAEQVYVSMNEQSKVLQQQLAKTKTLSISDKNRLKAVIKNYEFMQQVLSDMFIKAPHQLLAAHHYGKIKQKLMEHHKKIFSFKFA